MKVHYMMIVGAVVVVVYYHMFEKNLEDYKKDYMYDMDYILTIDNDVVENYTDDDTDGVTGEVGTDVMMEGVDTHVMIEVDADVVTEVGVEIDMTIEIDADVVSAVDDAEVDSAVVIEVDNAVVTEVEIEMDTVVEDWDWDWDWD